MQNKPFIPRKLVSYLSFIFVLFVIALLPMKEVSACYYYYCYPKHSCYTKYKYTDPCATATIYVVHQTPDGILLKPQEVYTVSPGYYGPYLPQSFPDYGPGYLAPNSAPASGTIKGGQAICITYYYKKNQYGTIIVSHIDAATYAFLKQETFKVPVGRYGPYYPESFPGYGPGTLLPGSDLPSGTIYSDGLKTIYFMYSPEYR